MNKQSKIIILIVAGLLIILSFTNIISKSATNFLVKVSEESLASLAIVTELEIAATAAESSKIPLVSGISKGVADLFDKVFNYLTLSNVLIIIQLVLLTLSKSLLVKFLAIIALGLIFVEKYSQKALKILIILLFINPGLSIYISGLHIISKEAKLELGSSLQKELTATQEKYKEKEKARKERQNARYEKQLEKAKKKGKDHISFINKAVDAVENTVGNVEGELEEGIDLTIDILKVAGKKVVQMTINFLVTIIVVFLILPLLYFYLLNLLLKRFFKIQINQTLLSQLKDKVDNLTSHPVFVNKK